MNFSIKVKPEEVRPGANGLWEVTRTVFGDEITFSGPNRDQVRENAQDYFNRAIRHHNAQSGKNGRGSQPKRSD